MLKKIYKLGELTLMKNYIAQERQRHTLIDLFWECTLSCNAKCKHCGSRAGGNQKAQDELSTEEIKMDKQLQQCPLISAREYDRCYFLVHKIYSQFFGLFLYVS